MKPLMIDLFCGLGGWAEGGIAEGYDVVGFDIEQHEYAVPDVPEDDARKNAGGSWFVPPPGRKCAAKSNPDSRNWAKDAPRTKLLRYPAQLVVQDVLTLHGSQFRNADVIVGSPPCQFFSYCAMPWTRAKALDAEVRADPKRLEQELALFNACFRIQREACEAAGRHIPLIVENVRGAIPWVGRSRWNFGSYHLWGDVPALMPPIRSRTPLKGGDVGWRERGPGRQLQDHAYKTIGMNWSNRELRGQDFTRIAGQQVGVKQPGISGARTNGKGDRWFQDGAAKHGSKSNSRKAASAMIAKIPPPLARHIARTFKPTEMVVAA